MKNRQNAEWMLQRASHYREHGAIELAKAIALAAQAEATLALVEQQRIQNVIALHRHEVQHDLNGDRSLIYENGTDSLRPEIAAALGIEISSRESRANRDRDWGATQDGGPLG